MLQALIISGVIWSYFKTSPQAQSLRWIEVVDPRNRLTITVVAHLDPLPFKVRDPGLALNLIDADPGLWAGKVLK